MQKAKDDMGSSSSPDTRRATMKVIASALVALSFLTGAIGPAAAYSGSMIEQLDKEGRGGHGQG
jgi:hypothetical protein